ncbi:MAG: OmpA family protein [Pseudomonadota bacterium]
MVAAGLSALVAGGAVALAGLGAVTAPRSADFTFVRGTAFGAGEAARLRAFLRPALLDERTSVTFIGHTGTAGDAAANQTLSEARAEAGAALAREMGLQAGRITALGLGGADPLPKAEGETARAFQSRLARLTVSLQVRR